MATLRTELPHSNAESFDVAADTLADCVKQLRVGVAMGAKRGHASLGVARGRVHEQRSGAVIADQIRLQTLHNFRSLCCVVNLDPLNHASLQLCVLLFSRQFRWLTGAGCDALAAFGAEAHNIDWEGVARARQQCSMATIHDWSSIMHYLERADEARELGGHGEGAGSQGSRDELLKSVAAAMRHAGLEFACTAPGMPELCALHMCLSGQPQEKMLERAFVHYARRTDTTPAHDLEVRCLRMATFFNNNMLSPEVEQERLLHLLCTLVPRHCFIEDMSGVLARMEEEEALQQQQQITSRARSRMQLRYLALSEASTSKVAYEQSFASWANQQRFPISTGQRLQQVMYFLRAQQSPVPAQVYGLYFAPALIDRVTQSTIDVIDADAMYAVLQAIRSYRHNVADLIDFRSGCLTGVSVTLRSALTLQQVLQLYIAAFQHPSVRETLWRRVLNVWNHSVQQALSVFTAEHDFDVENVLHTVMHGLGVGGRDGE